MARTGIYKFLNVDSIMKMKALLLFSSLLLCALPSGAETRNIDGINYDISAKFKTATVTALTSGLYAGSIVVPDEVTVDGTTYPVTAIGGRAFSSCHELTSVTLPPGITTIGEYAFDNCTSLKSLSLPDSLRQMERYAFTRSGLTSIRIPGTLATIPGNAFTWCVSLASVYLSDGVTTISNGAFSDCRSLTRIRIPETVTNLGSSIFFRCTSLETVMLPESVHTLPFALFWRCSKLSYIIISDSVYTVGDYVFAECPNLTTVYMGKNVRSIEEGAFSDCPELTDVYCCMEGLPRMQKDVFKNSYIDYATLHVPETAFEAYSNAEPWKNFKEIVTWEGDLSVGVSAPQRAPLRASGRHGVVTVYGAPADTELQVFDLSGRLVGSAKAKGEQTHIVTSLNKPQIVVVRAGEAKLKLSLR